MKGTKHILLSITVAIAGILIFNLLFFPNEYSLNVWNSEVAVFRVMAMGIGLILIWQALGSIKE